MQSNPDIAPLFTIYGSMSTVEVN